MSYFLSELPPNFRPNGAAAAPLGEFLVSAIRNCLPKEYVEFMERYNGGSGLAGNRNFLELWRMEDICPNNGSYKVKELALAF